MCNIESGRTTGPTENITTAKKDTIAFDEKGVCAACRYADLKEHDIDWKKREQELIYLCNKYRRDDGRYDCIVPGSGGKAVPSLLIF